MKSQGTSKAGEMDWEKGLEKVLDGIDRDEVDDGWWETSTGVLFGEMKLKQVKAFIRKAIQQAIAQDRERIAEWAHRYMIVAFGDYQHGLCSIEELEEKIQSKLQDIITNNHEDHKE